MEESEEEKMRRRREKAAAWAIGKRTEPMVTEQSQPLAAVKTAEGDRDQKQNASRDWSGWAREVSSASSSGGTGGPGEAGGAGGGGGGGWRNMVGGLQTLAASFGMQNSAALRQVLTAPLSSMVLC